MLKITYEMISHQKWGFGETKDTDVRTFYGENEWEIRNQVDKVRRAWHEDPAVKSLLFKEISRETIK